MIAAALEQHAAHAVPSQEGNSSVGMQAASGVIELTAAQYEQHCPTASAVAANGGVSAVALEVRQMELMSFCSCFLRFGFCCSCKSLQCKNMLLCTCACYVLLCHSLLLYAHLHTVYCFLSGLQGSV